MVEIEFKMKAYMKLQAFPPHLGRQQIYSMIEFDSFGFV
jgi:hypothetical protein